MLAQNLEEGPASARRDLPCGERHHLRNPAAEPGEGMQQGPVAQPQECLRVRGVTELAHLRRRDAHPRMRLQAVPQRHHRHPLHLRKGLRHLARHQAVHQAFFDHALDGGEHTVNGLGTHRRILDEIRAPAPQGLGAQGHRAVIATEGHVGGAVAGVEGHRRGRQSAGQERRRGKQRFQDR